MMRFWSQLMIFVVLAQSLASPARASFDEGVSWADISALDLGSILRSEYGSDSNLLEPSFPESTLDVVMNDADQRVGDEFRIPRQLRGPVSFWLRVYTQYTTRHIAIFDSRHPDLVYEVLDFREASRKAKSQLVYEVIVKNRLKKTLAAYRAAFDRLARNSRPRNPTREEKLILAAVRRLPHRHDFRDLRANLRTQTGQRDNIIKGLIAAESYFPKMESIFATLGLPAELARLSLVESSFNLNALSRVGAAGVWQFMEKSGREFLLIDDHGLVDERLSPLKATVAAAQLLKRNYRIFKSWPLAVTSYNHGVGKLPKASARKAGTSQFSDIAHLFLPCSKKKSSVGWASRNFYAEFLAVVHAEAYRNALYGKVPSKEFQTIGFQRLDKRVTGLSFAMANGIGLQEFRMLNPDIRDFNKPLPLGFLVAVPAAKDDLTLLTDARQLRRTVARATLPSRSGVKGKRKT